MFEWESCSPGGKLAGQKEAPRHASQASQVTPGMSPMATLLDLPHLQEGQGQRLLRERNRKISPHR